MADANIIRYRWRVLLQVPEPVIDKYLTYCLEEDYGLRIRAVESAFLLHRVYRLETESNYPLDFDLQKFDNWLKELPNV